MEEIGTWSCVSKSEEMMAIPPSKPIRGAFVREEAVKLHFADHWNPTGTWRKLSI